LKLVSLLLAFFLWFSINVSERDAEGTLEIPLQVRQPAGYVVTSAPAKPVAVTVRGPRTILDGVDERRARRGAPRAERRPDPAAAAAAPEDRPHRARAREGPSRAPRAPDVARPSGA